MNFDGLFDEQPDRWTELAFVYGKNLATALVILVIGLWLIGILLRMATKIMDKRDYDPALKGFLKSILAVSLKILLGITVLSTLGIEMTSFIALLGAAGLAVGMALSGTLQNFAGGVMILLFKPFKVGDYIEAQGYAGTVNEVQIFNTILKSPDNKTIIIPNGGLSTGSMVNYSTEAKRRVDWTFGIGYGDDSDKAQEVLMQMLKDDSRVLADPAPAVLLATLADSSVNFSVRAWVNAADYWPLHFSINERVYKEFGQHGLNIPFPQMDVHLHNSK